MKPALLLSCALLGACAGMPSPLPSPPPPDRSQDRELPPEPVYGPPVPAPGEIERRPPPRELEPESPPPPKPLTPASALLSQVDTALNAGDLDRAAALCERALRITPRDAFLWYRLAGIRYRQERFSDAVGVARRALSFAAANQALRRDIQQLLARAQAAAADAN